MDILNPQNLRREADRALARGREPKKVILAYVLGITGLSLISLALSEFFGSPSADQGGLSNLGTHAIYQTAQQVIPMLASLVAMCLELGYMGAMMRISRGQYADRTDLKVGFQKFWSLLRLTILEALICMGVGFLSVQLAGVIFAMTPWAQSVMDAVMALGTTDPMALSEADLLALLEVMGPMYIIAGIVYLVMLIPVLFRLRMANYCLLDDPQGRALAALGASNRMMRRRFFSMLKIDLSLWVYYLATVLMTLVMYLDLILGLLGFPLPMEGKLFSLLVYGAALAMQFGIQYLLRSRVELTYLAAYDKLREKPRDSGVVLGNIFDM